MHHNEIRKSGRVFLFYRKILNNFGKLLEKIEKNIRSDETIRKHVKKPKENQIKKVTRQAEQYLSEKKNVEKVQMKTPFVKESIR